MQVEITKKTIKEATITLTDDEIAKLKVVIGSLSGDGELRNFCDNLYSRLPDADSSGLNPYLENVVRPMKVK